VRHHRALIMYEGMVILGWTVVSVAVLTGIMAEHDIIIWSDPNLTMDASISIDTMNFKI